MFTKIKAAWDFFDGHKTKIAGYLALGIAAIQMLIIEEFGIQSIAWDHAVSIANTIVIALGGVGLVHKGAKGIQSYRNRDVIGG